MKPAALAVVAMAATLLGIRLLRSRAVRLGLLDWPGPRSLHHAPVPRVGGVAMTAALAVCVAVSPWSWRAAGGTAILVGALVVALVGLADDRFHLHPLPRLLCHVAAATAVVAATGGLDTLPLPPPGDVVLGTWGAALSVLWIVTVVNFYNFLDGIDGLAGLQGVITAVGLLAVGWDPFATLVGAALAGACLGFLSANWPPARVFLGDAGSGLLGFLFAAAPFVAPAAVRPRAVLFVALSLWLFLADALFTLIGRAWRRRHVFEPHREHLYQRLVATGLGHRAVTLSLGLAAAVLTGVAAAAWHLGLSWERAAIALALALFAGEWLAVRVREARLKPA